MEKCYNNTEKNILDFFTMACAVKSWNNFHHMMRQLMPLKWIDTQLFNECLHFATDIINLYNHSNESIHFDTIITNNKPNQTLYARCHVCTTKNIWHFVFVDKLQQSHRNEAAIIATLDTTKKVILVNLKKKEIEEISVINPTTILDRIMK